MVSRWEFLKQKKVEFESAAYAKYEMREWVTRWIILMDFF
jgi:hypothetical protein